MTTEPADNSDHQGLLDREAAVAVDLVRAVVAVLGVLGLTVPDDLDPQVIAGGVAGLVAVYTYGTKLIRSKVWSARTVQREFTDGHAGDR